MQIDEIINEKYPDSINVVEGTIAYCERQAAKFGYGLGEAMAVEFGEWLHHNQFTRHLSVDNATIWTSTKIHYGSSSEKYTTSELFQLFKLKTAENGSK